MTVDEYRFMCWLNGKVPSAIVIRNLLRQQRAKGKEVRKDE